VQLKFSFQGFDTSLWIVLTLVIGLALWTFFILTWAAPWGIALGWIPGLALGGLFASLVRAGIF
jgi:hypothetical protein